MAVLVDAGVEEGGAAVKVLVGVAVKVAVEVFEFVTVLDGESIGLRVPVCVAVI